MVRLCFYLYVPILLSRHFCIFEIFEPTTAFEHNMYIQRVNFNKIKTVSFVCTCRSREVVLH